MEKILILRHDVDKLPENSLRFAQIQAEMGIKGSYYFRIVPENLPDGLPALSADRQALGMVHPPKEGRQVGMWEL